MAAALFAASPWAVFFSRKLWAQNQPSLTLLFVAALTAWAARRRPWALTGALAAVAGLVGLHLGGLAFIFVLGVTVLIFHRRLRPLPLLVGLAAVLLLVGPYLLHDARHGWPNLRAFPDLARRESQVDLQAFSMAGMTVGGWHFWDLAGAAHEDLLAGLPPLWALDLLETTAFWASLTWLAIWLIRWGIRKRGPLEGDAAARLVLLCWLVVPLLLQIRHAAPLGPHYFILLYPAPHVAIALAADDLWAWIKQRRARLVVGATGVLLLVALIAWQVWAFESLLTFVDTHDTQGGYGPPIHYAQEAVRQAEALVDETEGAELLLLLPGADPRYDGWAAVFDVLAGPDRRLVDGQEGLILPPSPAVYLALPGTEPAAETLAEVGGQVEFASPLRGGSEQRYRILLRHPAPVPLPHCQSARWACGVELTGCAWSGEPRPGGTVRWTLHWRVTNRPPAGAGLHWFNHLVDSDGTRWGQQDGVGVPASTWRVGDTMLAWFEIPISTDAPPPPYFVRSGLYTYPDLSGVPLVDGAGEPMGDFVELGPLE
jgi:hypothetical protein